MAIDPGFKTQEYAGITGVIRFRRQPVTGLQVLQVERLYRVEFHQHGRLKKLQWQVAWKDADDSEAARISLKTGFVSPGQNIVRVDECGHCFNENDVNVGVCSGGKVLWRGGTVKPPVQDMWPTPPPGPDGRSVRGGRVYQPEKPEGAPGTPPKKP